MKAITIKQPYAQVIVQGIKDVENRTWKTNFRGRVLIHAGKTIIPLEEFKKEYYKTRSKKLCETLISVNENNLTSAIVGSVEIVDCVRNSESVWAMENHWHWILKNPVMFREPIRNVKGKLSFWEYVEDYELPF
jgi:hypothetical protein